MHNMLGYMC